MKISIDFLYNYYGFGAWDGQREVKRLEWLSVVECIKGRYVYSCDGRPAVTVGPGEFFIAPSGALQDITHRTDGNGEFECRYVFIDAVMEDVWHLDKLYGFPDKLPEEFNEEMHGLLLKLHGFANEEYCKRMACAYGITDILLRCGSRNEVDGEIVAAARYIRQNISRHISVQELCDLLCLSQAGLFRMFSRSLNCTPVGYINSLRVAEAAKMLVSCSESIESIAVKCGFESQAYFTRVFKRINGMTPGQYRKAVTG